MKHLNTIGIVIVAAVGTSLTGCGDNAAHHARCTSFAGTQASVTSTGTVTAVSDVADDNLFSYASLQLGNTTPAASVRATTGNGARFAAGAEAGAFVTFRNQGSSNTTQISTYLGGVLQETASLPLHSKATDGGTGADVYLSFTTTRAFDAVELMQTDAGSSSAPVYDIYELCADGDVQ